MRERYAWEEIFLIFQVYSEVIIFIVCMIELNIDVIHTLHTIHMMRYFVLVLGATRDGGAGGQAVPNGTLPTIGYSAGGEVFELNWSSQTGGRVSACTLGSDYFRNRFSPCEDIGETRFLDIRGDAISQTPIIQRGFKPGIGHRNNGGNGTSSNQAGGGSGAYGGNAGDNGSGGGGGSGYSNGEVEIISNGLGGNQNTNAFALFELFEG